ncbi:MAG: Gfo/Idh/MocA family protein [Promethearchaeota archaeon]
MKKSLNIGIVGYGLNSVMLKNELEKHPLLKGQTKLIVGYDPNAEANERLKKLSGVKVANTFEDLLDTLGLEAVLIVSPPKFHATQAISALESGKHVFSEIPMALKIRNLEKIIQAVEESGKIYQLGENYCFIPEVLFAGFLASSGKIGTTVYAESEYLHNITYRWRKGFHGDVNVPRINSWYQDFDPLMYGHTIGPAQVALGGLKNPTPFIEVVSYANDLSGYQGNPICSPAKAFQVALFKTENDSIAKCVNAYIVAREPPRISIQVIGNIGTYECYQIGSPGRLFIADDHKISKTRHRKGHRQIIDKEMLSKTIPHVQGEYYGATIRILNDWLSAIKFNKQPSINARKGANFCAAGIAASKSSRSRGKKIEIKNFLN